MSRLATNTIPYSTVAFHGDSFTLGLYASTEANTWRGLMTAHIQAYGGGQVVHRQATSGAKMTTIGTVSDAADVVSTYNPDLVFLAYGINDATGAGVTAATDEEYESATRAVLTEYAGRRVQVAAIPWCNWGTGSEVVFARAIRFNEILRLTAEDFGQYYVDVWKHTVYDTTLIGRPGQVSEYSPGYEGDNFHYNDTGHARLFSVHAATLQLPIEDLLNRITASRTISDARAAVTREVV